MVQISSEMMPTLRDNPNLFPLNGCPCLIQLIWNMFLFLQKKTPNQNQKQVTNSKVFIISSIFGIDE